MDVTLVMRYGFVHMTFFKMLRLKPFLWVLAAVAYMPAALWACEAVLKSSPQQLNPSRLVLPRYASQLRNIAKDSLSFALHEGKNKFWAVFFDPSANKRNEGYLVEGNVSGGQYVAFSVRRTQAEDEKKYFKSVARMHDIQDKTMVLNRMHAKCETVHVNGWIEAKLWLKHGLNIQEVKSLLEAPEAIRVYEESGRDRRYRIQAHDKSGNSVAIVIAEKEECPHILVTAYEESENRLH